MPSLLDNKQELWKAIPGYNTYIASNLGNIMKLPNIRVSGKGSGVKNTEGSYGFILSPRSTFHGHQQVNVIDEYGNASFQYVHRLVALAFLKRRKGCEVVCHLDDNPLNNSVSNLKWGTHYENSKMVKNWNCNPIRGKKGSRVILQEQVSKRIIELREQTGKTMREILKIVADENDLSFYYIMFLYYNKNPHKKNIFK